MDGYAVRSADTGAASPSAPISLRVVDESRAGRPAKTSAGEGEAIAISTGAVVPQGCDAIVRLEEARFRGGTIEIREPVEPGHDVRRVGDDVRAGELVLRMGTVLGSAELGVLASLGQTSVRCGRVPRIGVLTTGDELVEPGESLRPGAIRNANAYSIPALATAAGAEVTAIEHAGDDARATLEAIRGLLDADVVVVCGGVSVGEHDHVRAALSRLGAEERFWGVALRPGRPTWFGIATGGALVFGLPGNPVSAIVTFLLFVRPALVAQAGAEPSSTRGSAVLDEAYEKRPGRAHAVRVRLDAREDGWHARPTKEQGSHVLTSMLGADALAFIPADRGPVAAGERVEIEWLPGASMRAR
jgi:molybdopterin molybdotransferase